MKLLITEKTLTALNNLKGRWLLHGNKLMVIRDFQYIQETPEIDLSKSRRRRKKQDLTPKLYLIKIRVEGFNGGLKFVGTYDDDYCMRMIQSHQSPHYYYDLVDMANDWVSILEQKDAFLEYEKRYADKEEEVIKEEKV